MIHYHGTPVGGGAVDKSTFFTGKHCLVSFAYPADLPVVAECCQSFIFDSGAYTTWKTGKPLNFNGYLDFCVEYEKHPGLDWVLIPDVIDGIDIENDAYIAKWLNKYPEDLSVPVWHLHESLDRLLDLTLSFSRVALGSSGEFSTPGSNNWWSRMTQAMNTITDDAGRPNCKLHGLRMLNPKVFSKLPLASADSVNAAMNSGDTSRFGMYVPPSRAQRAQIIATRVEQHNSSSVWIPPCSK